MEGTKTLKQAKIGEKVTVVKLTGEGAVKRRIMDMGITKGTEIFAQDGKSCCFRHRFQ